MSDVPETTTPPPPLTPGQRQARASVLLSAQRALLGEVTPALRGVLLTWQAPADGTEPTSIVGDFYYDTEVDDDAAEHVSEVEGYVAADFGDELDIEFTPVHLSPRRPLPRLTQADLTSKDWVFQRYEGD